MKNRPWEISDLLALDEGGPHDASIDPQDPQVKAALDDIRRVRSRLQNLPDVPVDEASWLAAMPPPAERSYWLRFPLATAASVFFASVVGMYVLFGGAQSGSNDLNSTNQYVVTQPLDSSGMVLAGLMAESRDLERQLNGVRSLSQASDSGDGTMNLQRDTSGVAQMLLFRLAEVDGQIASLYDAPEVNAEQRQALWQQRVDLLESLVAVQSGVRASAFDNSRSL